MMNEFGMKLIRLGRYLDGFAKLNNETKMLIETVLNGIGREKWGINFLFRLGTRLRGGEIGSGSEEDIRIGEVIAQSFSRFKDANMFLFNQESKAQASLDYALKGIDQYQFSGSVGRT